MTTIEQYESAKIIIKEFEYENADFMDRKLSVVMENAKKNNNITVNIISVLKSNSMFLFEKNYDDVIKSDLKNITQLKLFRCMRMGKKSIKMLLNFLLSYSIILEKGERK
jgi:hypothetical protein